MAWISKKQTSISLSTIEAKYIVALSSCTQVIWMKQTLEYLQVKYDHPITINYDNISAISISKNHVLKPNISQSNTISLEIRLLKN